MHNVHPPGSLNEDTFRLHDDADSGLFSLFNYPASPLCPPSLGIDAAVAVFSLSLAERTESPARDAIMNYLREHASWGRNRKYRRTIMAISRKNRRIPYGVLPSIFLNTYFRTDWILSIVFKKRLIQICELENLTLIEERF